MTEITRNSPTEYTTLGPDAAAYERYATIELDEGVVLLYDREEEEAWLQSDVAVDLDAVA